MCISIKMNILQVGYGSNIFVSNIFAITDHIAYRIHVFYFSGNPVLPTLKSFCSLRADKFPNGILRLKGISQQKLCFLDLKEC
jgi:hypothetical protein